MSVDPRFAGLDRLYGTGSVAALTRCSVLVVGLGGVGSWAAEALARSGVGRIGLLDGDEICLTNTNRQLQALSSSYGRGKADVLAERLIEINPAARIEPYADFLTPSTLAKWVDGDWDLLIDAADAFRVKVATVAYCRRVKQPLIVVGSAGGRVDPTKIRKRDLSRTEHDALLALVRKKLRADHGFARNADRYFGVPAIYSLENVRYPQADGSVSGQRPAVSSDGKLGCEGGLGASTMVTASFGMLAASVAVERLLALASAE